MSDIFDHLRRIRQRPSMYVLRADESEHLREVQSLVWGYVAALHAHGIEEHAGIFPRTFSTYLYRTRSWSASAGFVHQITTHCPEGTSAMALFRELVDDARAQLQLVRAAKTRGERSEKAALINFLVHQRKTVSSCRPVRSAPISRHDAPPRRRKEPLRRPNACARSSSPRGSIRTPEAAGA